jgi:hypothetical protein
MSNVIGSDNPYSDDERQLLREIAGLLIPASSEYGIPGADDEHIFNNILISIISLAPTLKPKLQDLQVLAEERHGPDFLSLSQVDKTTLLRDQINYALLHHMITATAGAYYQDGRVLETIGLKSTPPFPGGHDIEQGDWSLLEPVKARAPFYRKVPSRTSD